MTSRRSVQTWRQRVSRSLQYFPGHVSGRVASAQPIPYRRVRVGAVEAEIEGIVAISEGYAEYSVSSPAAWPATYHELVALGGNFTTLTYQGATVALPGFSGGFADVGGIRFWWYTTGGWRKWDLGQKFNVWNMTNYPLTWRVNVTDVAVIPISTDAMVPSISTGPVTGAALYDTGGNPFGGHVRFSLTKGIDRAWIWSADPAPAMFTPAPKEYAPPTGTDNYPKRQPLITWSSADFIGIAVTTGWKLRVTRVSDEAGLASVFILFNNIPTRPALSPSDPNAMTPSSSYYVQVPTTDMPLGAAVDIPLSAAIIDRFVSGAHTSAQFYGVNTTTPSWTSKQAVTLTGFELIPPAG